MQKSLIQLFFEPENQLLISCPSKSSYGSSVSVWKGVFLSEAIGGLVGEGDGGPQDVQADRTSEVQPGHF